jgi:thiamine biosynthesis lipoprotein
VKGRFVYREEVMGTVVSFDVRSTAPPAVVEGAVSVAVDWLHWVDRTFSTYKPGSEVNRFDRGELPAAQLSAELSLVLSLCQCFARKTGGYFDAWAGGRFDPSGLVKGWSIDRASHILARHGMSDHVVEGGGDIRLRGRPSGGKPWVVGIRHPLERDACCAVVSLPGGPGPGWAVATSGNYERGLHVVDPTTGRPASELASVTVIGHQLTSADAYATAALAMGRKAPAWLAHLSGYESLVVGPDGLGWATPGFEALRSSTALARA